MLLLKYHLVRVVRMVRLCYNPIRRRLLLVFRDIVSSCQMHFPYSVLESNEKCDKYYILNFIYILYIILIYNIYIKLIDP